MNPRRGDNDDMVGADESSAMSPLPWPEQWPAPRRKVWLVVTAGYLAVLALLAFGLGVSALVSGETGPAVFLLGGGVYLGLITALGLWLLRPVRRVSSDAVKLGPDGVHIEHSGWLYRWLATVMLLTFAALAAMVVSGLVGSWPPSWITVGVLGVAALLCLWVLVEMVNGRLARGRIVLGPQGIHHRALTFEHFVPWYAVHDVSAEDLNGPVIVAKAFPSEDTRVRRTSRVGKQQEFQLLPYLVVRGRSLAVDPAVLYHALRYYHAHPDARAELANDAGLQRIRSGDLLT